MSTTYRQRPHQEATSADGARAGGDWGGSAWAGGQTGNGHADQVGDGIACLDVLGTQMDARGWTAYINTPAERLASLFVQDPRDRAEYGDIIAAPDGTTGEWWYWFSWAERIAPVRAPAAAADAIIRAFRRPADGPAVSKALVAGGHGRGRADPA
jgi:hypothetical protein